MIRTVVLDATVLINFATTDRLKILNGWDGFRFVSATSAEGEVRRGEQRVLLEEALTEGWIVRVELDSPELRKLYADLVDFLGSGEAASLALAWTRGWIPATDDKAALRAHRRRRGKALYLNTPRLYVQAIRDERLSLEEADEDLGILAENRFLIPIDTFADLL